MLFIIIYVVCFLLFLETPLPLQIIFMIVNFFVPDPIPIVDEALMSASVIKKILLPVRIMDFIKEHKVLGTLMIIGVIALLVFVISLLIKSF